MMTNIEMPTEYGTWKTVAATYRAARKAQDEYCRDYLEPTSTSDPDYDDIEKRFDDLVAERCGAFDALMSMPALND